MALQIEELLALQALDNEIGQLESEMSALDRGDRVERALAVRQAKLTQAERRSKENAARFRALMDGRGAQAEQDMVILNTAALLVTAGKATDLRAGAGQARDALSAGRAGAVLDAYVKASNG